LGQAGEWRYRHTCTNCGFPYRCLRKFHCERPSLVYLQKHAREFIARAQKQGSTSCSSVDENAFGLPVVRCRVSLCQFKALEQSGIRFKSEFGCGNKSQQACTDKRKNKTTGRKPEVIRGVMS
jgi:hypothetical protein